MAYRYPIDIESCSDWVEFSFYKYNSPIAGATANNTNYITDFDTSRLTVSGQPIYLNMPADISTGFTGGWGGKDTTSLAQFALKNLATPIAQALAGGGVATAVNTTLSTLTSGATYASIGKALGDDVIKALANGFNNIPGIGSSLSASDILQLTNNQILNPNTELLYGGPSLREHSYSFKLVPRSTQEADQVVAIIEQFKKAALPAKGGAIFGTKGNNFLNVPDLCKVTFKTRNASGLITNVNLPNYKVSGIKSVSAGYITEGNYMAYTDGRPVGISLSISLIESKLVFREDIGSNPNNYR